MNKSQLIELSKREIDCRRYLAEEKCEKTLEALRSHADFAECEKVRRQAMVKLALGTDEQMQQAKAELEQATTKYNELLAKYHVSAGDLEPHYSCAKCNDTGYVDGKACSCLLEEMRSIILSQSNIPLENCSFEASTENQPENVKIYKMAKRLCDEKHLKNFLLLGPTGTGKTYLLCSCANRCAKQNQSVLFVTAYKLNNLFLECYLGDLQTKKLVLDNLTDVDVLVIDDLGTEKTYKNVTAEYTFILLNERMTAGKQTFISTNLSLAQLREKYDERVFSRLIDQKQTFVAKLNGKDKRFDKA